MNLKNMERDVLHMAIEMFRKNTGLTLEIEPYPVHAAYRPDAVIRIIMFIFYISLIISLIRLLRFSFDTNCFKYKFFISES